LSGRAVVGFAAASAIAAITNSAVATATVVLDGHIRPSSRR